MHRFVAVVFCFTALIVPRAQLRVAPLDEERGHVALGLALRHLANTGIFMHSTAHPDDENNGLLVMLNRGQGYRTALATATRGNGGQNEIGPEIFEALGVLRTEELAALHRFDGAEQYFTRAVDFGYSFSLEETFEKWGRDEIIADYVRLIRMVRPDVIVGLRPDGFGGGQHHQASAVLTREAFKLAGDPTAYPEQIKDGLRPWKPRKFYFTGRFGFPGEPPAAADAKLVPVNQAVYDPLLGKTYAEIGTEARSMHKCQGMGQLLALPGPSAVSYQLVESAIPGQMLRDERTLFDGVDTSVAGLAAFAGAPPPKDLVEGLSAVASAVQAARRKFESETDETTIPPLVAGLRAVRVLRGQLRAPRGAGAPRVILRGVGAPGVITSDEAALFEIDFRLRQKESEFQQALIHAAGVRIEALADDGVVVPGQPVRVSVIVANRGAADVTVKQVKFSGFDGDAACSLTLVGGGGGGRGGRGGRGGGGTAPAGPAISTLAKDTAARCEPTLTVPANARITEPYWHRDGEAGRYTFDGDAPFGLPFRPTPFYVQVTLGFPGAGGPEDVIHGLPVQYRYESDIFSGEKRTELLVAPAFSVRVSPEIAIIPVGSVRAPTTPARPEGRALQPTGTQQTGTAQTGRGQTGRGQTGRGRASARPTPPTPAPPAERELRVTIVNGSRGPAESVVKLELPQGWTASPAQQVVKLTLRDDAQTVRFQVRPAPATAAGEYHVRAIVSDGARTFARGYQVIEYPHIHRQHIYHEAAATLKVIDVKTAPNLTVGYVMGVGDEVPPAIEQLGARLQFLTADDLAWGDLSRFDAIVTGVRAYERREDLRANNRRLLDYVQNGGALVVQYNKFEFNQAQYGPYPAAVSSNRVTDEFSPVTILAPADPVLNVPNKITEAAWKGWVQERGLYFLGNRDAKYVDLVQLEDPFPNNPGPKLGALVETTYGKGRWVYVGLGLWRQLPAGTDGAYQILANLISLGRVGR